MLKISILCSDSSHPVNRSLEKWAAVQSSDVQVRIFRDVTELSGGDFLFLVSCHQYIKKSARENFRHALVLHASDLPFGRGMSPHVWQILEGASQITISLLNVEDEIDSGDIWHQHIIKFDGTELYDEIDAHLFEAELLLMSWALKNCDIAQPYKQIGPISFYPRRTPLDSKIDPTKPLTEVFDLLRIANPDRYPAYFDHRGQTYVVRIDKVKL